jgi:pimeloyl-ACP methyl ester carboxylesterase
MNKLLCEIIDRFVLRAAAVRMPRPTGADPHYDEALRLLESPDFFAEATPPPEMTFTGGKNFQFPSPVVTACPENNLVRGKILRCGKNWRKRPAVVLLHGWNDRWAYRYRFPSLARHFLRRGINSVMFELPYHYLRRPAAGGARNFISEDVGRTMQAAHQALAEVNSVVNWLSAQGCPRLSLAGYSLGGWLGGFVACYNPRLTCAVLITPVSRMDRMIDDAPFCEPIRQALIRKPMNLHPLNLASHKPKLPRSHLLVVQAEHDKFVPADTCDELWEAWGNPEMWTLPHGHITILASSSLMRRTGKWISQRLKIPDSSGEGFRSDQVLG